MNKKDYRWCEGPDGRANLATLARWLGDQGITAHWTPDDWADLMEKAHRWTTEWNDLQAELLEEQYAA